MSRLLSLVLAVALPVALVMAWRGASTSDGLGHAAAGMERRLRAAKPTVVVLGSSVAFRDVDRGALAEGLGLPVDKVVMATVPASTGAHWLAVLRGRVLDLPEPPKVVLVVDALASLLTPDVEGHEERLRLADHLTEDDPDLAQKAFGDPGGLRWERRRMAWRGLRRAWVGAVPDAMVGALWGLSDPAGGGRQLVLEATDRAFGPDAVDRTRAGGLPDLFRPPEPERRWRVPERPQDSFLPEILDATSAAGVTFAFVRAPFPTSFPEVDRLPPPVEADAVAWLLDHGGRYLDARTLGLDDLHFSDRDHLNPDGARTLTAATAAWLAGQVPGLARRAPPTDALPFDPAAPPWRPPTASLRLGDHDVAPLDASGGVVVPAGGALTASVSAPWPEGATVLARARVPDGAGLVVRWGDGAELGIRGGASSAAAPLGVAGPAAVTLRVAAEGADVPLDALAIVAPTRAAWLVGDDVAARGPVVRLTGGRVSDHHVVPVFSTAPPPVPEGPLKAGRGPRVGRFVVPRLAPLADKPSDPDVLDRLDEGAQAGNDYLADACSPVRVLEDGAPLPWPNTFCAHVGKLGYGRSCHVGDDLLFSASDGSDPLRNGRRYTLALAEDRRCRLLVRPGAAAQFDVLWLYPGDVAALAAPSPLAAVMTRVSLRADAVWGDASEGLEVRVGGARHVVPADALRDHATASVALTLPAPADATVQVGNPGTGFWRVTYLALEGR